MKRSIAVIALAVLVVFGASAQLAFGFVGSLYGDMDTMQADPDAVVEGFKNGEGLFYGGFVELGMGKLALGAGGQFSFYEEDWSYAQDGSYLVEMMDYDVDVYMQLHLFKYKAFLDPFVQGGIGMMARDFANETDDPDSENPVAGTIYGEFGAGLGINLGSLGIFVKGLYMVPTGNVETNTQYWDGYQWVDQTVEIAEYAMQNFKVTLGAKIIL